MSIKRIVGFLFLLASVAAAAIAWQTSLADPRLVRGLVAACPLLGILGLALIVLPSPYEERTGRNEYIWEMTPLQMVTARWWLVVCVAGALAVGGYYLPLDGLNSRTGSGSQTQYVGTVK